MTQTAFVFDPATLAYDLGQHHPFKSIRPQAVKALLAGFGIPLEVHGSQPASLEALLSVHAKGYVSRVQRASQGLEVPDARHYGLGTSDTPIFPAMHDATAAVVGATLQASRLVRSGAYPRALNLAGGLHHARRDAGSGFCVYNDLSVAIQELADSGWRVVYLDVDAHHGDGVQWLHYDDPRVLTISLHESGRYLFPGTGYTYELGRGAGLGYTLNVPLEPYTEDASYLDCLERVLEPALAWFKPDVLVLQGGADSHFLDPLAELALTAQGYASVYRLAVRAAQTHAHGRIIATGGGGYATLTAVPRVWAQLYAALEGIDLPDAVPDTWLEIWSAQSNVALPRAMRDPATAMPRRAEITARNAETVTKLLAMWREVTGQN
jgi:acetoin utilization protein AcuC